MKLSDTTGNVLESVPRCASRCSRTAGVCATHAASDICCMNRWNSCANSETSSSMAGRVPARSPGGEVLQEVRACLLRAVAGREDLHEALGVQVDPAERLGDPLELDALGAVPVDAGLLALFHGPHVHAHRDALVGDTGWVEQDAFVPKPEPALADTPIEAVHVGPGQGGVVEALERRVPFAGGCEPGSVEGLGGGFSCPDVVVVRGQPVR